MGMTSPHWRQGLASPSHQSLLFCLPIMPKNVGNRRRLSRVFLFLFTCLLTVVFSLNWVNAEEEPKPKPELWQIQGIMAALNDDYPQVKTLALDKLGEYKLKNLKSLEKELRDITQIAANLLKDKSVEAEVRSSAASALGNLGTAATPYVKDILNFLKDKSVEAEVRSSAASALGKLGTAATPNVKDIADILKDKSVEAEVRSSAASALGNLGTA
ncbi:MAG: hypothetical protein V7K21_27230, partial [Nostoc sp.]|uniref:HEAT repeat domain-containing protein n=1 Tax=Nostoc sp. TaxID=1180 RepID=UPI003B5FC5CB